MKAQPHYIRRSITLPSLPQRRRTEGVTITLASEEPLLRYFPDRGIVAEVLLMRGLYFRRPDRRQVCLLASDRKPTVRNVIGSVRNLRTERGALVGEVHWARDPFSRSVAEKFADGTLTDFYLSSYKREVQHFPNGRPGMSRMPGGDGPTDVVTLWAPMECVIGAPV